MIAVCADDAWIEDDGKTAMVVYPLHAIQGHSAQVGFAVNMTSRRVITSRLLLTLPEGIFSATLEALPVCGSRPQPCRDTQLSVLPLAHSKLAHAGVGPSGAPHSRHD